MFGNRIPLKSLAISCRSMSTMLYSGVAVKNTFDTAAKNSPDPRCKKALIEASRRISQGEDISSSFRVQGKAFPPLVIEMVAVAEQTGSLPEVLESLADHFDNIVQTKKDFASAVAFPIMQFLMAVLIVGGLIFILGLFSKAPNAPEPVDFLGLGLTGPEGAIKWFMWVFGLIFCSFILYKVLVNFLGGESFFHRIMLKVPVIGKCLQSLAIARFSWAYALTQQAGMPLEKSLKISLNATANGAFQAAIPQTWSLLEQGETLSTALTATGLFPIDYLQIVEVSEVSGTVPETLDRLSPKFGEQAKRSMEMMAAILGRIIWTVVAVFIIYIVFSIFKRMYLDQIQNALEQIDK